MGGVDSVQSESTSNDGCQGSGMNFEDQDDWLQLEGDKMGGGSRHVVLGQPFSVGHLQQLFGQFRRDLNLPHPQPHMVNLLLPKNYHQQPEQQEQQEQQQQLVMPISHELLMESRTDLFDMGNMSGSDGYDSGGAEPSRRCSTHRRFPEPTCSRGHAGFVRQRTLKLNGMKSQPVFPWLSERSSSGSQANPTTTQEVPQEPKGCAVIAGGSTVTTRRHATASGGTGPSLWQVDRQTL